RHGAWRRRGPDVPFGTNQLIRTCPRGVLTRDRAGSEIVTAAIAPEQIEWTECGQLAALSGIRTENVPFNSDEIVASRVVAKSSRKGHDVLAGPIGVEQQRYGVSRPRYVLSVVGIDVAFDTDRVVSRLSRVGCARRSGAREVVETCLAEIEHQRNGARLRRRV